MGGTSVLLKGEVEVQGANCWPVQHHKVAGVRAGLELHPPESHAGFSTLPFLCHLQPHKDKIKAMAADSVSLAESTTHSLSYTARLFPMIIPTLQRERPRLQGLETCMRPWGGEHGQLCLLRVGSLIQQSHDKEVPGEVAWNRQVQWFPPGQAPYRVGSG